MTLRELLDAATSGPWKVEAGDDGWDVERTAVNPVVYAVEDLDNACLIALAPDMGRLLLDMADALTALTFENYRGIVCFACGWDASHQPREIVACLSCGGELVARITAKTYREHSDALLARFDALTEQDAT